MNSLKEQHICSNRACSVISRDVTSQCCNRLSFRLVQNMSRFTTKWLGYLLYFLISKNFSFKAEFFLLRPTIESKFTIFHHKKPFYLLFVKPFPSSIGEQWMSLLINLERKRRYKSVSSSVSQLLECSFLWGSV